MSAKTLNAVQAFHVPATRSKRLTYSIAPTASSYTHEEAAAATEFGSFLENENPLGCIRGVFWVMAFNATVFLLGFTIWAFIRYLR